MRRSTLFSGPFSLIKAGFAGAFVLATILSCSDNTTAPAATAPNPLGGYTAGGHVPDSLKHSAGAFSSSGAFVAPHIANDVIASPTLASAASLSAPTYTVSSVPFTPEPAPQYFVLKSDDETHFNTEIGFDFTFYGNTYHQVNISANGFVAFDSIPQYGGCCEGAVIPFAGDAPYNNLIAIAWTDLNSSNTGDIRAETQGTAPHRKFVVQYNNVQEYFNGPSHVTAQLVLAEGSNDITIYTFSENILTFATTPYHAVTQGIENADGTEAEFVPGRVHSAFALTNDAVRFSFAHVNQPPVITAPANISVATSPPATASGFLPALTLSVGSCAAVVNPGTATASDDADGVTITGARSDGLLLDAAYPKGMTTITWTATDAGGLTATASQTVTVNDTAKPSIKAPADISTRTDRSATTATVALGSAAALDNCPDVSVAGARSDGAGLAAAYPIGLTTVTWIATDASGNTSSANQQITVIGNKPPVIAAPPMLVVNTDPGVCVASVNVATPGVTDDTQGSTIVPRRSDGLPLGAAYPKGITTITWTATDADGATSVATQTVAVNDNQKPSIQVPADISTRTDRSASTATVAVGSAAALDNCPDVSVVGTRNDGGGLTAPYPIGLTTVTWTASDASRNTSTANQQITVVGNKPPVIAAPTMLVVNTDPGVCMASVSVATPAVTDDTEGTTIVSRRSDGLLLSAAYPKGLTTIMWTATDADGATSSASQIVTVNDGEKPSFISKPADISTGNDHGLASAVVAVSKPSAVDNCREVSVDGSRSDGAALDAPYNVGVTTINWMARDAARNSATTTQAITVLDKEAPTINVPADMRVNATLPGGEYVSYTASWSDNVGVTSGSCAPLSGAMFPIGPTTVNCSASDAAGNKAFGSFTVTVLGPADQMMSLIDYVLSRNLPNGITNPLVAQLRAAARTSDNHVSCVKMSDFTRMVVKDGSGIPGVESSYMIDKATDILGVLGCPDGVTPTSSTRNMSMPR